MTGSCHCNAVSVTLAARPEYLNDCNCSLCTKVGALWGYLPTADFTVNGATSRYARHDVAQPAVHVHFCPVCGSTTHASVTDPAHDMVIVNMRLFDPVELDGVELRFPDGRAWDRTTPFGYVRKHAVFGQLEVVQ